MNSNNNNEILEIRKKLEELENRIIILESHFKKGHESVEKKISAREFFINRNPQSQLQKTLAIGYYLEKYENMGFFNVTDLKEIFRKIKEKPPANISDMVNKNVKKGFITEVDEKKDKLMSWTLTSLGERFVNNNFRD